MRRSGAMFCRQGWVKGGMRAVGLSCTLSDLRCPMPHGRCPFFRRFPVTSVAMPKCPSFVMTRFSDRHCGSQEDRAFRGDTSSQARRSAWGQPGARASWKRLCGGTSARCKHGGSSHWVSTEGSAAAICLPSGASPGGSATLQYPARVGRDPPLPPLCPACPS